jgi:hypothetical protein
MKPPTVQKPLPKPTSVAVPFSPYVPPVDPPRKNKAALLICAVLVGVWIMVLMVLALLS